MANEWYTFGPVNVYDSTPGSTNRIKQFGTGGKFVLAKDGVAQTIRDLNGTTISEITTNEDGQSIMWQAQSLRGFVQFGDIINPVFANEVADLLANQGQVLTAANVAVAAAQQAVSDAQAAVTAAGGGGGGGSISSYSQVSSLTGYPSTFPPSSHSHPSGQINDSTTVGRQLLTAADAVSARSFIGAGTGNGTSNLALGTTSTTAAAGNHAHSASSVAFTPTGSVTASDVQTAIAQAASLGGGGGGTSGPTYTVAAQGGSTDNRSSINAMIAQANAAGGGTVELGPGLHRLTGPLDPLVSSSLVGSGMTRLTLASGYTGGTRITVTDGVLNGTTTVTSATANFAASDVGKRLDGNGIPSTATIVTRVSATQVTISAAATVSATGVTLDVGCGIITLVGKNAGVKNIQIQGGTASTTDSSLNPAVGGAIVLGYGASYATVENIDCTAVNGYMFLAETWRSSGLYGGIYDGIRGNYNAKGIRIAGDANNRDAQVFLDNLDPQVVQNGHVLDIDGVNDVQVGKINGCVSGAVANMYGLRIAGNGSTIQVDNFDVGSYPTFPGVAPIIRIGDGGTPNNVRIKGPVAQGGTPGILIDGGFNISLQNLQVSRCTSAGVRITGGDLINLVDLTFARNGYTAGAGQCEVEVSTTTGRVRIARSDFTTPYGTSAQQVDTIFKLPAVNRVQIGSDNRYTGGHGPDQMYASGNRAGQIEPTKTTYTASDYALAGWSFDPALATGNTVLTPAGTITGARIFVPEAMTITTLWTHVVTAGAGLTTGQCFATIFDSSGTRVATTVDQAAGWASSGLKAMALAASATIAAGWYDVGFWFNGTTGPAFARAASIAAMNANLTGQTVRYWTANTGLTTAAPATLGTKTAQSLAWWISAG